jgi:bifunctional non-homologous end joining protein LigD
LDRQPHPDGYSNCEVINYSSHIAEVLLPHLAGRPVTFVRFPDGVGGGQQFFEKNVPNGAPDWLPSTGSRSGRGEGENEYALLPPDLLVTSGSKDAHPDYGSQVRWDNVYRTRTAT